MSRGWDLYNVDGNGRLELQRDDEAGVFDSDAEAWSDFIAGLYHGDRDSIHAALRLLSNWANDPVREVPASEPALVFKITASGVSAM